MDIAYLSYKGTNISSEQLEFAAFSVENVAEKLNIKGDEAYKLLTENSNILNEYIISYYEMLHIQSKEYIVNDIVEYMKDLGVIR